MPGYKTHLTASSVCGTVLGSAAMFVGHLSAISSIFAGSLCAIGGLVPDMDSQTSESFRRCLAILAGFSSLMLVSRLRDFSLSPEGVAIVGGGNFIFCWFVVGGLVRKITVHRGMFHSLPTMAIAGELMYLLSSGGNTSRLLNGFAMALGVLVHLILDEFYSIDSGKTGKITIKKSFGTALKLIDYDHKKSTAFVYAVLFILTYTVMNSTTLTDDLQHKAETKTANRFAEKHHTAVLDYIESKYPEEFDKAVLNWAVDNQLKIQPAAEGNEKWEELQKIATQQQ